MPCASRFLHQTVFLYLSAHDQAWIADTLSFIRRGSFPTFYALSSIRTGTPSAFDSALAHLAVRPNNGCQDYTHNSRYLMSFTPSRPLGAKFWPAHCLISGFPPMYSVHRRLQSRPFFDSNCSNAAVCSFFCTRQLRQAKLSWLCPASSSRSALPLPKDEHYGQAPRTFPQRRNARSGPSR